MTAGFDQLTSYKLPPPSHVASHLPPEGVPKEAARLHGQGPLRGQHQLAQQLNEPDAGIVQF